MEQKYSIDDWVIVNGYCPEFNNKALKITKTESDYYYYFEPNNNQPYANFSQPMIVRMAENHEIPQEFRKEQEIIFSLF